jgi:hypothetical protein
VNFLMQANSMQSIFDKSFRAAELAGGCLCPRRSVLSLGSDLDDGLGSCEQSQQQFLRTHGRARNNCKTERAWRYRCISVARFTIYTAFMLSIQVSYVGATRRKRVPALYLVSNTDWLVRK